MTQVEGTKNSERESKNMWEKNLFHRFHMLIDEKNTFTFSLSSKCEVNKGQISLLMRRILPPPQKKSMSTQ